MLTGTRNMIAMIFLSGFVFANWNSSTEIFSLSSVKIETNVFKYGLIYYSTRSSDTRIEDINPLISKSFRQLSDQKFIIKTRRYGNRFYHQFYKQSPDDFFALNATDADSPSFLVNPGTITFPFTPYPIATGGF